MTRSVSIGRGLAKMESPAGTILSYATQSGRTAIDGDGRNSPYTSAFLRHIEDRDEIATVFQRISANVFEDTRGAQVPELSLSFFGRFYLNGSVQINVAPTSSPASDRPCAAAETHWRSAEAIGTVAGFEEHLAQFPNCPFAGLAKARIESLKGKTALIPPVETPTAAPHSVLAQCGDKNVSVSLPCATTLSVNARDNIYAAGRQASPGDGNFPSGIAVRQGEVLTFNVSGKVSLNVCCGSNLNDADGVGARVGLSSNTGTRTISGIIAPNAGYLVGVFVPAGGPKGHAPAALNFIGNTSFASLSPLLDQVFFIGDGLTGNGTGEVQTFVVPSGASMLYLGISDATNYNGSPNWYRDNVGTFKVVVTRARAIAEK